MNVSPLAMSVVSVVSTLFVLIAVKLTHLQALLIFALVITVSVGFLGRRNPKDRVKYILWTLLLFLLVGVGIGWAMYPFSR